MNVRAEKIKRDVEYMQEHKEKYVNKESKLRGKTLVRNPIKYGTRMGLVDDPGITLDKYYVQLINDALWQIRHNKKAWVFNTDQLKEILRFEPDVDFMFHEKDEVIYIWK